MGEGELGFWEALRATAQVFITARLQQAAAARLHHRRQQQAAAATVTRRAAAPAAPPAPERYDLSLINMFSEYMCSCYLSMFIMLSYASSLFDLHVVVM